MCRKYLLTVLESVSHSLRLAARVDYAYLHTQRPFAVGTRCRARFANTLSTPTIMRLTPPNQEPALPDGLEKKEKWHAMEADRKAVQPSLESEMN